SPQLKRLEIAYSFGAMESLTEALKKFPLLEELSLYTTNISKEAIEIAGRYCPMLKILRLNKETCKFWAGDPVEEPIRINEIAIAIGENLTELRNLALIGSSMENTGLQAIVDGCRHLESLDLRNCWCIDLDANIGKTCSEKIKCLKLPDDSLEDCPYLYKFDAGKNDNPTELGLRSNQSDDFEDYDPLQIKHEEWIKGLRFLNNILRRQD
ncbi:putative F-box/LRR-repeat protein 23, partial [Tanacetum coccineum]